jgi:sugar/nucleoside kinase (ribokinase family)
MADIGCAGILVADTFCGPMDRLPKEGELLAVDDLPVSIGGCASNVAIDLARQGLGVDVVGCVGADMWAEVVLSALQRDGVGTQYVIREPSLPTSQTVVLLVKGQDRRFVHVFGANRALSISHLDRDWLRSLKAFYLGGLFVLPSVDLDALAEVMQFCRANGVMTVLDVVLPQSADDFSGLKAVLPHVDYFLPNDDEGARITGESDAAAQARVLRGWGAKTVVITEGDRGVVAAQGDDLWRASAFNVETVDNTGGGDAFAAGLITGVVRGLPLPDAMRYGCALGASSVMAIGTTTGVFTAAQAADFLASHTLEVTKS